MSSLPNDALLRWLPIVRDNAEPGLVPFVMATMQIESGGNEFAKNAKSGASGLLQIMPFISKDCGIDPFNPVQNIQCGVRLMGQIRTALHKVDHNRFQVQGFPGAFERRAMAAGYVRGWSAKAGVARDLTVYRGDDWQEFLASFPAWKVTSPYVERVAILTDGWENKIKGIYVAEKELPEKPSIDPAQVPTTKTLNGKTLITLLLTFFLSLVYVVVRSCDKLEVIFK